MTNQFYVDYVEKTLKRRLAQGSAYSDREFRNLTEECVGELAGKISIGEDEKREIAETVFASHRKLGILQPLLDDPEVNEIMINGTENIFIERKGRIEKYDKRFSDAALLLNVIQSMVSWVDRTVNESSPVVDARLSDGSRVNIVLKPVAINGPIVTIRKFPDKAFVMSELVAMGCLSEDEAGFLEKCVRSRVNIFVSGGTSSGKTTFLNVLCRFIPEAERIVTVEDSAELRLTPPNLVRLETREPRPGGAGAVSMRTLIKTALRMRPDRIIVGEVRDSAAVDMLQAMCTGHDGSMSTAHSNSARDIITRIETMALWEGNISIDAVRQQIASGLDLVVHMQRGSDMRRFVSEICYVAGIEEGKVLLKTLFKNGVRTGTVDDGTRIYEKTVRDQIA
ncbi:MAG: CpaF family protein [Clostridia bacterium]|nr:CpaF family protein [Clostridia bacterium]